jgi:hypothetical protein
MCVREVLEMAEAVIGPQKGWPRWANRVILWIGVPTGMLLALIAFFGAAKDFGGYVKSGCEAAGYCAAAKPTPPVIPSYSSSWVDGGHNVAEFCEPRAQHYRAIYPAFNIIWRDLGEGRDKVGLGHAIYQYNCGFEATPK